MTVRKGANLCAPLIIAALLAIGVAGVSPEVERPVRALGTVWYVAPTGNDANTCSSPAAPCRTINAAIGEAGDGDTVRVAVGTYTASSGKQVVYSDPSINLSGGWDNTFTTQSGMSVIDGQGVRVGMVLNGDTTLDHFIVQNGHRAGMPGGIWSGSGALTINSSVITHNWGEAGGGIGSGGTLTVNFSTISENSGDGAINLSHNYWPVVTINNTTISNNSSAGAAAGIHADALARTLLTVRNSTFSGNRHGVLSLNGVMTIHDSTFSGNTGDVAIRSAGPTSINNTTITGNSAGIRQVEGTITLSNTIVAGNSSDGGATFHDCEGTLRSGGYNIIGSASSCTFIATTGDQVGKADSPIDPKLGLLADHGGATLTQALLAGSPAIDRGNPTVEPGSGGSACLEVDQRGFARPALAAGVCDVGAYEQLRLAVDSIKRADPDKTSAASVDFSVAFNDAVTGVQAGDFAITTSAGIVGASITTVTGSGSTYTVTVNTGKGHGTIRLDVKDNDGIKAAYTGQPLGGPGSGNGNFTSGETYTIAPPSVQGVNRLNVSPTSATMLEYTVIFSTAVTGVRTVAPYADFRIIPNGLTGSEVTAVSGSGQTYTVTVKRGTGSGYVRLDVVDDGSIVDAVSGRPLGGPGPWNGNFTAGQSYAILPMPLTPMSTSWDTTPTYTWTKLAGVTQYRYQLLRGRTAVYSYIVPESACGASVCSATPTVVLPYANDYTWRVQAFSDGLWRSYSPFQGFSLSAPAPRS